ncbi:MAG: hypothetical protein AAFN70_06755, partial [Planctomycetota bacterium]
MDQLKDVIASTLRYGFWITCAIVAVIALGIWFVATGSLNEAAAQRQTKLKGDLNAMKGIRADVDVHPNSDTEVKMQELIKAREQEVLAAWTE